MAQKMTYQVDEFVKGLKIINSEKPGTFEVEWIAKRGPDSLRNIVILIQNTTLPICQRLMGLCLEAADWENAVFPAWGHRPLEAFDHKTMVRIEHIIHLVEVENNLEMDTFIVGNDSEAIEYYHNMLKEDPR